MTLAKKPFKMPTMKQDRELAPSRRRQRRSGSSFRNACRSRFRSHLLRSQPRRKNPRTCCEGPFGEVLRATAPMAKVNPFRFSTKYQDDETDLLYYGYRYYSAGTGRWLNHDPLTDEAFARGLPFWAKRRFRRNATLVQDSMLTSSARQFSRTTLLTSGPKGPSSLLGNISPILPIVRETSNPYRFVENASIVFIDELGLKPCSSCSAADIKREGIARGLEYIHRSIEENREYGAKICCNDCLSRVYSANVVYGPIGEGTVNVANSKCSFGDKIVADWHTHPDGSTQTGGPNQTSEDKGSVTAAASPSGYDCDYVGFMTNSHLDTTMMDGQGVETTVGTSSGDMNPLSE